MWETGCGRLGSTGRRQISAPTSIEFNRFLELIFFEISHFCLVTKLKHAKSGLCSRRINFRKRSNLIDVGVKIARPRLSRALTDCVLDADRAGGGAMRRIARLSLP